MNKKRLMSISLYAMIIFFLYSSLFAVEVQYKDYKSSKKEKPYFKIELKDKNLQITVFEDDRELTEIYKLKNLHKKNGKVYAGETVLFNRDGMIFQGEPVSFDKISNIRIYSGDDYITVSAMTLPDADERLRRFKKGNKTSVTEDITIYEEEFIRGAVLTITGNVEIYGEVNEDVITILGDVYVGPGAVVRGDIVSFSGRVDLAKDASVYGESYGSKKKGRKFKHRFTRDIDFASEIVEFVYNRVDGATPYLGIRFLDVDSVLPEVWAKGGYAFNSERWRYDFGIEQTILHFPTLSVGGSIYQRLASEDDWLLSNWENTVFALLVTEDFKDYYEAEGGTAYLRFKPFENLITECRYRHENTKWLEATANLWSLFGGDKKFGPNFGRVEEGFRAASIREIDTSTNACLYWSITYDTRDFDELFTRSSWHLKTELEWSHPDFKSDYDYRRYSVNLRRYQRINRHAMLLFRGIWGGSDGYLPMYKRFYLGGLGTFRGYKHKELMGTRFWMGTVEYRIEFPRTDIAISVFWDGGQIANETKLDSSIEVKHDIGLGINLGDEFRINIAKRLDRSYDDDPKIYVRLDHIF